MKALIKDCWEFVKIYKSRGGKVENTKPRHEPWIWTVDDTGAIVNRCREHGWQPVQHLSPDPGLHPLLSGQFARPSSTIMSNVAAALWGCPGLSVGVHRYNIYIYISALESRIPSSTS